MAIDDPCVLIRFMRPPNSNRATANALAGTSTPAEVWPIIIFHPDSIRYHDCYCHIPEIYDGGGFTVQYWWSSAAGAGDVIWSGAFRALPDDAEDLTAAHTYAYNDAAAATTAGTVGEVVKTAFTFDDGSDSDGVQAGEICLFRIRRFASDSGDTLDGNAYLHRVSIRMTGAVA